MEHTRMNATMHTGCKYDQRPLKFTTGLADPCQIPAKRPKMPNRDPLSHRIIEKRRRDRMNNCLADLSHLIPANYTKQGQGRIEKTEIIEMAIKYINHLLALIPAGVVHDKPVLKSCCADKTYQGFSELALEVTRFLGEKEGMSEDSGLCVRLQNHLQQCSDELRKDIFTPDTKASIVGSANPDGGHLTTDASESSGNGRSIDDVSVTNSNQNVPKNSGKEARKECQGDSSSSGYYGTCEMWESQIIHEEGSTSPAIEHNSRLSSGCESSHSADRAKEIYKYKNNIQLRFNAMHSDGSLAPEEGPQDTKRRVSPSESTESSNYPFSEASSYSGNSSGIGNCARQFCPCSKKPRSQENVSSSEMSIPGFALHQNGTHYVPVALQPSCLSNCFNYSDSNSLGVFHPISIPVNFGSVFGLLDKKKSENMSGQS